MFICNKDSWRGCTSLMLALAVFSVCASQSGCGSSSAGVAAPPVVSTSVTVPASVQNGVASVLNFGDSITCGVGATSTSLGYASLLDSAIAAPAVNLCRSGDQAADMTTLWTLPYAMPSLPESQVFTVLIGTNDAHACGISAGCMANWYNALQTSLIWLSLPKSDKIAASAASSRTGTWLNDLNTGLATGQASASLSFPVKQTVNGRTLFLAYRVADVWASNPGTALVEVDGVPAVTLSAAAGTGQPIATGHGTVDTVFVQPVPLGVAGNHLVTVTVTSTGGQEFSLQWLGVSSSSYAGNVTAPRVLVGTIIPTESDALSQTVDAYNIQLLALIASLKAQGMQIIVAPTAAAIDPATDLEDLLHPNDGGHLKLAQAFASALD